MPEDLSLLLIGPPDRQECARAVLAERLAKAFERFFGAKAPAALAHVPGLTPGDFQVVAPQLRFRPRASAAEILVLIEADARAEPESAGLIGF